MAGAMNSFGEVVTIDNFGTKLPPIKEKDPPTYGLVDMGSNGIRFSITDLSPPTSRLLRCIYRERAGISLYDALHESSPESKPFYFSQKTITQVAGVLTRFKSICDSYNVHEKNILVFATEAMRTAKNRDDMLQAILHASGMKVEILSPPMESLFGALGARSGYEHVDGLFMDLGGGSVQMTYVNSNSVPEYYTLAAEAAKSLPYGAAKLTEALRVEATALPAKLDLKAGMKKTFDGLKERFKALKEQSDSEDGITIYLCGGGFRGYGSMLMSTESIKPYPIPAIGGYTVSGARFKDWPAMLQANRQDGKIFGLSKRRREQFPAIIEVISALVAVIPNIKEVTFCSGGNREGVLYTRLPTFIRESNPLLLLPGVPGMKDAVIQSIIDTISSTIPKHTPQASELPHSLYLYLAKQMYLHMGRDDTANSSKSLHRPISGSLSSVPGLTHKTRALYSLTMCARWGTDLGPIDKELYNGLRQLIGPELSFLCEYIGTAARLLGLVVPAVPKSGDEITKVLNFKSSWGSEVGKKGMKHSIAVTVHIKDDLKDVIGANSLVETFGKVGKGLELKWKIRAVIE